MRDIKVRAWHKPTCKMFNVYTFTKDDVFDDTLDGVHTTPTVPADRKDCILMQSIGLKDKNGNEIFEGDIVKYVTDHGSFKVEVVYDKFNFCLKLPYGNLLKLYGLNPKSSEFEILGNFYENSKILEEFRIENT